MFVWVGLGVFVWFVYSLGLLCSVLCAVCVVLVLVAEVWLVGFEAFVSRWAGFVVWGG